MQILPSTDRRLGGCLSHPIASDVDNQNSFHSVEAAYKMDLPSAVDFMEFYTYSRKDARVYLSVMFWIAALVGVSTGILLWIIPLYGILWIAFASLSACIQVVPYVKFFFETMEKVQGLKRKLRDTNTAYIVTLFMPPGGTRAPPSSLYASEVLAEDAPSVNQLQSTNNRQSTISEMSSSHSHETTTEPVFDEYTDRIINNLHAPRRRETFEAEGDDLDVWESRFRRVDTESGNRRG
jgi:hypothetical protein